MPIVKQAIVLCAAFFMGSCDAAKSHTNVKACQELSGSISREKLVQKIGQPYKTEPADKGFVLFFGSNPLAAGPVRVLVNKNADRVVGKKCLEDEEWVYFSDSKNEKV